jgi:hypothetical protein
MVLRFDLQLASEMRARAATTSLRVLMIGITVALSACDPTDTEGTPEPQVLETFSSRDPRGSGPIDLVMGADGERIGFAVGDSAESVNASEDAGSDE